MSRSVLAVLAAFALQFGCLSVGSSGSAAAQSATPPAPPGFEKSQGETGRSAYLAAVPQPESLKKMSTADQIAAIEEIKLLALRYSRCITQKDWQCLKNAVFAQDFYYLDGPARTYGWAGFMDVMKNAGCYDRVYCRVTVSGQEIELVTPTLARGITTADFTFAWMDRDGKFPVTGKEVVGPGEESFTNTYYYRVYTKVDGKWRLRTNDHVSFDLRRTVKDHVAYKASAFVGTDGSLPPTH
jgi:hypothetical protein